MSFKTNFNRICREKGTTPTAILNKWGESTSSVTRWNHGALPKEAMLHRLADELGCSVADFFAEADAVVAAPSAPPLLDEDEQDILRIFRAMSRRERHEFMAEMYRREGGTFPPLQSASTADSFLLHGHRSRRA